jgi:hypothetical protein
VRTRVTIVAVTLVLLAGVTAAWWFESNTPRPAGPRAGTGTGSAVSTTTASGGYRVLVTRGGHQLASFGLAEIEAMPSKTVVLQGGTENGPSLLAVLASAGAGDFTSVTILGPGTNGAGRLDIAASEIGPDTVLDIAKRGTVKVAGPNIPFEKRVRDITEIQVK